MVDTPIIDNTTTTLRIATAGSVDDGKSTLIGRLLHDTKTVFEDQLKAVVKASRRYGDGETNLALLTDGLRAEREQGITIDVAHRYFATPRRSFIVADTPGHAQYTRNMVTGASTSDVAIVLVDARHGVLDQTRRHALIASMLGTQAIVLAVNKMDLVDWSEARFREIAAEVQAFVDALPHPVPVTPIPISALLGDNVVDGSDHTPWYDGAPLLDFLETFEIRSHEDVGPRVHVQRVIRPQGSDFRGYAGVVSGGWLRSGDPVTVLPGGQTAEITAIHRWGEPVEEAGPGHAVTVELDRNIDIARGDVITSLPAVDPLVGDDVVVDLCWMVERPLTAGSRWWFKHGTRTGHATVTAVLHHLSPQTLEEEPADELTLNDLGRVRLQLSESIVADPYHRLPEGGRMILIDPADNTTAAAAMLHEVVPA
ncbi:MAG: sulfate adenylyltransferase subunit 1 [Ilumatobacteraceae bacterium]